MTQPHTPDPQQPDPHAGGQPGQQPGGWAQQEPAPQQPHQYGPSGQQGQPGQYGYQQPAGQPGYPGQPGAPAGGIDENAKLAVIAAHLGALLTSFVLPLIIFLVFKDKNPRVREEARQALNFNITMLIAAIGLGIATGILGAVTFGMLGFLVILAYAPTIMVWIFGIIATVTFLKEPAGGREPYKYPLSFELVK